MNEDLPVVIRRSVLLRFLTAEESRSDGKGRVLIIYWPGRISLLLLEAALAGHRVPSGAAVAGEAAVEAAAAVVEQFVPLGTAVVR